MATPAKKNTKKTRAPYVVVRTYSAGVHVGVLSSRRKDEVDLTDARRLWHWRGANTLHEVALHGVDANGSKVSEPVPEITVLGVIEVIPTSKDGEANLRAAKWSK